MKDNGVLELELILDLELGFSIEIENFKLKKELENSDWNVSFPMLSTKFSPLLVASIILSVEIWCVIGYFQATGELDSVFRLSLQHNSKKSRFEVNFDHTGLRARFRIMAKAKIGINLIFYKTEYVKEKEKNYEWILVESSPINDDNPLHYF